MIRKLTFFLVLATLGVSAGSASAFFENNVVSPRLRAMGESSVAVLDGAYASFQNPGGLGELENGEVAAAYVRPFRLDFTDFFFAGAALPVDAKYGNVGLGISHFKVGYRDTSLLKETQVTLAHGVMLYEDDVMLTAAAMMGTDLVEGDRFRKAVQKCHDDA